MAKPIDWTKFSSLVAEAMRRGAVPTKSSIEWDASLGCSRPYRIEMESAVPDTAIHDKQDLVGGRIRWILMDTPCRKCETCLKNRQRLWRGRMIREIKISRRTWFATFTINPHHRFMFSLQAGSTDYHESYKVISKEITKYFKRLRKAGWRFRYIAVAEAHKDGYPHLHMLVHEVSAPIPKSRLQAEWPYGFTTFKLVKEVEAAHYVAKYLAKDARTRIRASQRYGQSVPDLLFDLMEHHLNA